MLAMRNVFRSATVLLFAGVTVGAHAVPSAAQIAGGEMRCYARAFSADYLSDPRNAGLSLVEIALVMDTRHSNDPIEAYVVVRAMPRDQFGAFVANDGTCLWDAQAARYHCGLTCNGQIDVVLGDDGTASLINVGGFTLGTICAAVATEGERYVPADDAHAAFSLVPLPAEACPVDLWTAYDDG